MICDLQVARSVFGTQWPDVVIHLQNLLAETHNKLILGIAFWNCFRKKTVQFQAVPFLDTMLELYQ